MASILNAILALIAVIVVLGTTLAQGPACGDNCDAPFFADQTFTPVGDATDDFKCSRFRCPRLGSKWIRNSPKDGTGGTTWAGRQPLLFVAKNIYKKKDHLTIEARGFPKNYTRRWNSTFLVAPPGSDRTFVDAGYNHYTGGFVQTTTAIKYGYFESRFKPTKLELVSAFWMSLNTPERWTEIDMVEAAHVSGEVQKFGTDFRRRIKGNAHIFRDVTRGIQPGQGTVSANPPSFVHNQDLADGFNTYAVFWNEDKIEWFFNGRPFAAIDNVYWKEQPLHPKYTVESNFQWQGVLPDVKQIERTRRAERRGGVVYGTTAMHISHIRTYSTEPNTPPTTARQAKKIGVTTNQKELRKARRAKAKLDRKVKNKKERFDVLQKAPYGAEKLLEPVPPPPGKTWEDEVEEASARRRRRRRR